MADKWEGLVNYKYSLIIENYSGPDYWSEKLADCLLSWTLPIYYGCTNIEKYFPKNAIVSIDISDRNVGDKIARIISNNYWEKQVKLIGLAREMILDKYQFFPFFSSQIRRWEEKKQHRQKSLKYLTIPKETGVMQNIRLGLISRWKKMHNNI